jgi:hypothetical protein
MAYGSYDNETELYSPDETIENGLWLETDDAMWIVPTRDGGEIEGCDDIRFKDTDTCFDGRYITDVLNEWCRNSETGMPTREQVESVGLRIVPDVLKRFNPQDGYYHA